MATIGKVPVTLTPAEADQVHQILTDYSRYNFDHARRTKSASIRTYAKTKGNTARDLGDAIVRRLYTQS